MAIAVALLGTALGYAAQAVLACLLRDLVSGDAAAHRAADALWLGLVTAVVILVGFALPPLLQLQASAARARAAPRTSSRRRLRYLVVYGLAIASVLAPAALAAARCEARRCTSPPASPATFVVLALAGAALVRSLAPLRGGVGVAWRYGLANIARRGRDSVVQIVAFGLGLMVLLLLALVRDDLLEEWRASLPADAPNYFMINIRPDEGEALRAFFADRGLPPTELVPMVRARLTAINGVPADEVALPSEDARQWLEREANLTWTTALRDDNRLIAGEWWREGDGGGPRVSVEREFAASLGLAIGDRLTYDTAGEPIEARVASLREVTLGFLQAELLRRVLARACWTRLRARSSRACTSSRRSARSLVELVRRFPEVTIIDIDALLSQVRDVMDKAALAVQYVFLFTLLAGTDGAGRLGAGDARRAPLRERNAAHPRGQPARRAAGRRRGVHGARRARRPARGRGRDRRRLLPRARGLRSHLHAGRHDLARRTRRGRDCWSVSAGVLAARSVVTHPPMAALR